MKNFVRILSIITISLLNIPVFSQLLKPGDAVITYSGLQPYITDRSVLKIVRLNNSSSMNYGTVWENSLPSGIKCNKGDLSVITEKPHPVSRFITHESWITDSIGKVFGITIDDKANIFVARTSVFGPGNFFGANNKKILPTTIFCLNNQNGDPNVFFTINNSPIADYKLGLGNIKYFRNNIYATNFQDGRIYKIEIDYSNLLKPKGVLSSSFNPKFDDAIDGSIIFNDNTPYGQIPWGLAIARVDNKLKLYYSRYCRDKLHQNFEYGNSVWSVELDSNGDFIPNTEVEEISFSELTEFENPISDIAITADGKSIFLAEKMMDAPNSSFSGTTYSFAHYASVVSLFYDNVLSKWTDKKSYKIGGGLNTNSCGGVSLSNSILKKDNLLGCDSTVWVTGDALLYPRDDAYGFPDKSCYRTLAYGIQGMHRIETALSANNTDPYHSLVIDADNEVYGGDKRQMGDVEVYNKPINCVFCQCQPWPREALLYSEINEAFSPSSTRPTSIGYASSPQNTTFNLSFPINSAPNKIITSKYSCAGNCKDSTVAHVINSQGNVVKQVNMPMQLSVMNEFACGIYTIRVIPYCGDGKQKISCDTTYFKITITCEPPNCCPTKPSITVNESSNQPKFTAGVGANASSLFGLYLDVNTVNPLSEIRVTVEDFQLSGETGCISCKNYPATWGNLWGGSFNGEQMNATKGAVFGSNDMSLDNREVIYRPGSLINAQNGKLALAITLPPASDISCCIIKASICLKITFKDSNCKECIKMIYLPEIEIRQPKSDKNSDIGPGSNQKQKMAPNKIIITESNM
jgi:hypothetical protein